MAQGSTIEWTDATWNPVAGCKKVSDGCRNCYAERMSRRLASMATAALANGQNAGRKANYLEVVSRTGSWNGSVYLDRASVTEPLKWNTPRIVFVNSMSDLFHEDVPDDFLRDVFETMNSASSHIFQVLTKRAARLADVAGQLKWTDNIWIGTSVEDDRVAHRVESLRQVKAKVRFLSVEPMIGPLDNLDLSGLHWVIAGGESGPGSRPMDPRWVRTLRDRCVNSSVPFFFKQWGGVNKKATGRLLDGRTWDEMPNL